MEDNKYYVYMHIKEITGEPFYIGKGRGSRYCQTHNRNKWWYNVVDKHGFDIIFLEKCLTNTEAMEREIYWINRIGRKSLGLGPLINLTDGGEGTSGRVMSDDERIRIGNMNRGKIVSKETRKKLSDAMKLREPLIGEKNGMYGKKLSDEHIRIIKDVNYGSNNIHAKGILSLETGIFYETIRECAEAYNINYSSFKSSLNRGKNNKFKKLEK